MPLYKITERRLKRKERDEETGLAGIKAALRQETGGEGTDDDESDSSDSDSNSDGDSDSGEEDDEEGSGSEDDMNGSQGEEAGAGELDSGLGLDGEDEDDYPSDEELPDEEEDDEEEASAAGPPPMSIEEALTSPIYTGPATKRLNRRESMCVLCPGKKMHTDKIVEEHLASALHKRGITRYKARLAREPAPETEDPRELVREIYAGLNGHQERAPKGKRKAEDAGTQTSAAAASQPDEKPRKKKKKSKAQRTKARAEALLSRIGTDGHANGNDNTSGGQPASHPTTGIDDAIAAASTDKAPPAAASNTAPGPGVKLNRQAKRLLARQRKQAGKQPTGDGSGDVGAVATEKAPESGANGGSGPPVGAKAAKTSAPVDNGDLKRGRKAKRPKKD